MSQSMHLHRSKFNGISKGPNIISEASSSMLTNSLHCLIFLYTVRFIPQAAKDVEKIPIFRHRSGPWLEHKERQIIKGVKNPPLQIV